MSSPGDNTIDRSFPSSTNTAAVQIITTETVTVTKTVEKLNALTETTTGMVSGTMTETTTVTITQAITSTITDIGELGAPFSVTYNFKLVRLSSSPVAPERAACLISCN